jgi:NAD(P)-dependent dehydrogenase (short-subunit alcohol dehydrogenase family)
MTGEGGWLYSPSSRALFSIKPRLNGATDATLPRAAEPAMSAREIQAAGGQALAVPTDVRDRAAIQHMVEATLTQWGRVDVLVNNAGLGHSRRVVNLDPAELRDQVSVNLVAVIECAQTVLPAMMRQKSGHIVNVASIAGFVGLPGSSVYAATKAGVISFSDSLRRGAKPGHPCDGVLPRLSPPTFRRVSRNPGAARRLRGCLMQPIV